jgi:predicted alpha/beta-fold hydrolase
MSRGIYHAGRTEDVRRVMAWVAGRLPGSPIAVVGFSLGANLALKLAAEAVAEPVAGFDAVVAANPPLDLAACARHIQRPGGRIYDRNFVRLLLKDVERLHAVYPDLGPAPTATQVRTLYDFDEQYTAARNGFAGAEDYYARSSSGPLVAGIRLPGLVLHAADDPFIPAEPFLALGLPPGLRLELLERGGHLGYLSRDPWAGDRRWLDARITAWLWQRYRNALLGTPDGAPSRPAEPCTPSDRGSVP